MRQDSSPGRRIHVENPNDKITDEVRVINYDKSLIEKHKAMALGIKAEFDRQLEQMVAYRKILEENRRKINLTISEKRKNKDQKGLEEAESELRKNEQLIKRTQQSETRASEERNAAIDANTAAYREVIGLSAEKKDVEAHDEDLLGLTNQEKKPAHIGELRAGLEKVMKDEYIQNNTIEGVVDRIKAVVAEPAEEAQFKQLQKDVAAVQQKADDAALIDRAVNNFDKPASQMTHSEFFNWMLLKHSISAAELDSELRNPDYTAHAENAAIKNPKFDSLSKEEKNALNALRAEIVGAEDNRSAEQKKRAAADLQQRFDADVNRAVDGARHDETFEETVNQYSLRDDVLKDELATGLRTPTLGKPELDKASPSEAKAAIALHREIVNAEDKRIAERRKQEKERQARDAKNVDEALKNAKTESSSSLSRSEKNSLNTLRRDVVTAEDKRIDARKKTAAAKKDFGPMTFSPVMPVEKAYLSAQNNLVDDGEKTIITPEPVSLNYDVRFPGTSLKYRSGEYIRLPAAGNNQREVVQLTKVPEVVVDNAGGETGVTFTYQRADGSTETKTYYKPLEKIEGNEIQSIYKAGDIVRIPTAAGFELVRLVDRPAWNTESETGETSYIYTYEKQDGSTETKAYYEPLQKIKERFSAADLARYEAEDRVELTVKGKKIIVALVEKPKVELDENGVQKILFTYDLGNGVNGTHYAETLPRMPLKDIEKAAQASGERAEKAKQLEIDALPDLTADATIEPYPSLDIDDAPTYTFGEYVLYEAGGRWQIGSIQAEPKLVLTTGKIEFKVLNASTGVVENVVVDKPLNKYKPLESKKVSINGIDYTVEDGHIGVDGEIEYQLLSRRNEVVPNVDIETIRNLQETEKLSREMKDKIRAIEFRIKDLATHKVRDLMNSFNGLQLRLLTLGADFGSPRAWNTFEKNEIKDMERNLKKFKQKLDRDLRSLEESVREQEHLYQEYEDANHRKVAREDVEKDMKRLGITDELKKKDLKDYYRRFEEIYEELQQEPGNPLYKEITDRLADHISALEQLGKKDPEADTRYLIILEEVLEDWKKEKLEPPHLNFEKEYKGEGGLMPKFKELEAAVALLEKTDKAKYDKVVELFFAAERALDQVKEHDPKLPLALLKTWQAFGKLEIALGSLETADRKKEREGTRKLERVELPTKVLNEMIKNRPAEMRHLIELLYRSHHQLDGNNDTPLLQRKFIINENPAVTEALQNLFPADVPPNPAIMAMLRIYGVKDWKSFKDAWDTTYASEVGMALHASIAADIRQRALYTDNKSYTIKDESLMAKILGRNKTLEETFEGDDEKVQRVASKMFGEELSLQPNGSRDWLSPEVITKYAAEMAIGMRLANAQRTLEKLKVDGMDEKTRRATLARVLGIAENQIDEVVEERIVNDKKFYGLKKNVHSIIEQQIAGLEERMGLTPQRPQTERTSLAQSFLEDTERTLVQSTQAAQHESFDGEIMIEKRREFEGVAREISGRIEGITERRKRFKDTWTDLEEVKDGAKKLAEEVLELKRVLDGTSADKEMVELAKSPSLLPIIRELVLEGEACYNQFRNAKESKSSAQRLRLVEGGLKRAEDRASKLVTEGSAAEVRAKRVVVGGFLERHGNKSAAAGMALIGLLAGSGVFKGTKKASSPSSPVVTRSSDTTPYKRQPIQLVQDRGTLRTVAKNERNIPPPVSRP